MVDDSDDWQKPPSGPPPDGAMSLYEFTPRPNAGVRSIESLMEEITLLKNTNTYLSINLTAAKQQLSAINRRDAKADKKTKKMQPLLVLEKQLELSGQQNAELRLSLEASEMRNVNTERELGACIRKCIHLKKQLHLSQIGNDSRVDNE